MGDAKDPKWIAKKRKRKNRIEDMDRLIKLFKELLFSLSTFYLKINFFEIDF